MSDTYRAQLVHTLRKVLKPLVRILFRAGVRIDEFIELLRGIYVEIVINDAAALDQIRQHWTDFDLKWSSEAGC